MGASTALIRFKKTGNIYMGCYESIRDTMNPYICKPLDCYDKKRDWYRAITYCRDIAKDRDCIFPKDVPDLDEVDVYSDWNFGGWFSAIGSESARMIDQWPLDEFGELDWDAIRQEKPDWVDAFWKELRA